MSLFYTQIIKNDILILSEEESRHCIKVLRKKEGDQIDIIDGQGNLYKTKIIYYNKDLVECKILTKELVKKYHPGHHIAISPTKNADRIEWFVEKAVEIGIGGLHFIETSRTERSKLNIDRIKKIIVSAMKQSKNIYQPSVRQLVKLNDFLTTSVIGSKYIAHLNDKSEYLAQIPQIPHSSILLIGPEGDFSIEEVQQCKDVGYKEVALGQSVLRTETAGIFGLITMNSKV